MIDARMLGAAVALMISGAASGALAQSPQATTPPTSTTAASPVPEVQAGTEWQATQLLGKTLVNALNQQVGSVSDILIDGDGKVVAVLVGVGGFLGLGETTVPIALRHLVITGTGEGDLSITTSLSREAIEEAARHAPFTQQPAAPGDISP